MSNSKEEYSEQEVFDKAVDRLRDGTGRAVDQSGVCLYLNTDGLKCVVGEFIPDGHDAQLEQMDLDELITHYPTELPNVIYEHEGLLNRLQSAHDSQDNWHDKQFIGDRILNVIAQTFGLTFSAMESL